MSPPLLGGSLSSSRRRPTPPAFRHAELDLLRQELLNEFWGAAVERWVRITDAVIDIYSAWDLHTADDLELAPAELQFAPLFQDRDGS